MKIVPEDACVVGISSEPSVVPLRFAGVDEGSAPLERILGALAEANVALRSFVRAADQVALLVPASARATLPSVVAVLRESGVVRDASIGAGAALVSVVGSRLNARLSIAARMFRALSREGINSECLGTSEARIWCLVGDGDRQRALGALQEEFVEELSRLKEGQIGI